jgi:hypothetical protein
MYMDDYLKPLVGQDIHVAVEKLGYPDAQRTMLGDTIYVWERSHRGAVVLPTVTTTTGNVAGEPVALNTYGGTHATTVQDSDGRRCKGGYQELPMDRKRFRVRPISASFAEALGPSILRS